MGYWFVLEAIRGAGGEVSRFLRDDRRFETRDSAERFLTQQGWKYCEVAYHDGRDWQQSPSPRTTP